MVFDESGLILTPAFVFYIINARLFFKIMLKISVLDGFCWTDWVNLYPANEGKDIEVFTRFAALQHGLCLKPIAIDYARADGKPAKEKLKCNFFGCRCVNSEQEPGIRCSDYKVRFLCKCKHDTAVENPSKYAIFHTLLWV